MRDPVADVLAERQKLGRNHPAWLFLSLFLHAGIAVLLIGVAQRTSRTELTNVLNVRFAGSPAAARPSGTSAVAAKPASVAPKPVAKPAESPKKPAETPKPVATAPDKSLFGKAKPGKKPAATPVEQPAAQPTVPSTGLPSSGGTGSGNAPLATASGAGGIGTAGVAGIEGGDFPFTIYISRMLDLIGKQWFRPQSASDVEVGVVFTILRDGTVRDAKVEKSSESATHDRAALRSVIETSPLPPLPFAYSGSELRVHLTFH